MERTLTVLWKHSGDQAEPCLFCTDTRKSFTGLLEELLPAFREEGIELVFEDETVSPGKGMKVNAVELNGISLSLLLSRAAEGEEYCHASKCMPIQNLVRQIPGPDGILCGEAPEILFRKAILIALEGDIIEKSLDDR
ncbi:MAG: DUF2703 domain-containing protein [Methanoregulaceae archaeon]|jgi:hypothetical protein|nr:DUF2703 domain-containing protein [Methanoregulaceae archaeon]MCU0629065.1 DUF2703 domain-containing protein [Methanoregulaceae archaeon]